MSQINARDLLSQLSTGLKRLYVLYGEEPLQHLEAADAIRAAARKAGFSERTVFTVTGAAFDWPEVLASLTARGLFSEQQIVEVRFPSGKPGRDGAPALLELAQTAAQLTDVLVLVALEGRLDRASKNTAWFKTLDAHGTMVMCEPVERAALPQWIIRRLQGVGLHLMTGDEGKRTLAFLADHVEGNLLAAHQEIAKLALLYPAKSDEPRALTFDEVETAVTDVARYDLFALTQAILAGQVERSMRMFDGLLSEGQPAVRIHWVLSDEIGSLWRVRQALDHGQLLPLALRENRVWGARERLYERCVSRLSRADAEALVRSAHICDGLVKGLRFPGWPASPPEALRRLILQMLDALHGVSRYSLSMDGEKRATLALHG